MRPALSLTVVALSVILLAAPASAIFIDAANVGDVYTVQFDGNVSGTTVAGLTAAADVQVVSYSGGQLVLDITLANTTNTSLVSSSRVSGMGFDVSTAVKSASTVSGGLFQNAVTGGKLPNGFGGLDVCITDNRNNCSGGGNGGVTVGQSGTTRLALALGSSGLVELTNFGVRYQSVGPNGLSGTGQPGITPGIPEPGAFLVFAAGAGLVGLTARRRRR
jgi:hypothetical protein